MSAQDSLGVDAFTDRELTLLQMGEPVARHHSMIDGLRLGTILAALDQLGIDPGAVVLHASAHDCIVVTVKP